MCAITCTLITYLYICTQLCIHTVVKDLVIDGLTIDMAVTFIHAYTIYWLCITNGLKQLQAYR